MDKGLMVSAYFKWAPELKTFIISMFVPFSFQDPEPVHNSFNSFS